MVPTSPGPRNVVVVLLDSLNRHMLGCYGGTEFDTPNLDRFARDRATRFTNRSHPPSMREISELWSKKLKKRELN